MNAKLRSIEVDIETAEALEARATARGVSVPEFLAELVAVEADTPRNLDTMRAQGRGPWAPDVLAEDARRLADFSRTGEGVPWDDVRAWIRSWGTGRETPPPKPRRL